MPTTLITGCDYGIGYEFARQYANDGWQVHATCLDEASRAKISALGNHVTFHQLDVSVQSDVAALSSKLSNTPVDLLLNNAATFAPDGPGTLRLPDIDEFTRVMRVNAVAPIYVANAFEKQVARSSAKRMVFIGTRSASIGDNNSGGYYAYRCSKAALNMAVKSLSVDFAADHVTAVVLHPGSVTTETRKNGQISVTESVSQMRAVIETMSIDMSGTFQRFDGGTIEW